MVNEVAFTPPMDTEVTLVSEVPVIITTVPVVPCVGVKELMAGLDTKPASDAEPPGVVTFTLPELPEGTVAEMVVAFTTLNDAGILPKLTALVVLKLVPVMSTSVPAPAVSGEKEEMVGGGMKINPPNEPMVLLFAAVTLPEDPLPTTALIAVSDSTVKEVAAVPPNLTEVTPVKFEPFMLMVVPAPADVGVKEVINIGGAKLRYFMSVSVLVPLEIMSVTVSLSLEISLV